MARRTPQDKRTLELRIEVFPATFPWKLVLFFGFMLLFITRDVDGEYERIYSLVYLVNRV